MIEAQNEMRRRRGAEDISEEDVERVGRRGREGPPPGPGVREAPPGPRGRAPGLTPARTATWRARCWSDAVAAGAPLGRGCSTTAGRFAGRRATPSAPPRSSAPGSRPRSPTPTASRRCSITSPTSPWSAGCWGRRAASPSGRGAQRASPRAPAARSWSTRRCAGSSTRRRDRPRPRRSPRAGGSWRRRRERWRIPVEVVDHDPGDHAGWARAAADACRRLTTATGRLVAATGGAGADLLGAERHPRRRRAASRSGRVAAAWLSSADQGALASTVSGGWSSWSTRNSSPTKTTPTIAKKTTKLIEHARLGRPVGLALYGAPLVAAHGVLGRVVVSLEALLRRNVLDLRMGADRWSGRLAAVGRSRRSVPVGAPAGRRAPPRPSRQP